MERYRERYAASELNYGLAFIEVQGMRILAEDLEFKDGRELKLTLLVNEPQSQCCLKWLVCGVDVPVSVIASIRKLNIDVPEQMVVTNIFFPKRTGFRPGFEKLQVQMQAKLP